MADCGLIISAVNKKSLDGSRRKEMKWRKARRREWENETKGQRRRTNRCIHILISFIKIIRLIRLRSLATNEAIAQRRRRSGVHTLLKQASVYIYIYAETHTQSEGQRSELSREVMGYRSTGTEWVAHQQIQRLLYCYSAPGCAFFFFYVLSLFSKRAQTLQKWPLGWREDVIS